MAEMIRTSVKICGSCIHGSHISCYKKPICNYFLDTGQRRGCPVGYCDKYDKGVRPKKFHD